MRWLCSPAGSKEDGVDASAAVATSASAVPYPLRERLRHQQRRRIAVALAAILATGATQLAILAASGSGMESAYMLNRDTQPTVTSFPMPKVPEQKMPRQRTDEELEMLEVEAELEECAERGTWDEALALLEELDSRGLQQTSRAWNFAASAIAMQGPWEQAVALLAKMQTDPRVRPNHETYRAVLEACEQDAMATHHQVDKLLMSLKSEGLMPMLTHYVQAISTLAKAGQLEQAIRLYQEASSFGLFNVWVDRGRSMDMRELPIDVCEVILRSELEKRAVWNAQRKAGRGGFYVLTGMATKKSATKQQALVRIMQEEYRLKVRVDPAKFGRFLVKNDELVRTGREMASETAKPGRSAKGNMPSRARKYWKRNSY